MSGNVTKEGIEVRRDQIWRDLDTRMVGRTVKVLAVYSDVGKVNVEDQRTGKRTYLSVRRMHKGSTGWALVTSPTKEKA